MKLVSSFALAALSLTVVAVPAHADPEHGHGHGRGRFGSWHTESHENCGHGGWDDDYRYSSHTPPRYPEYGYYPGYQEGGYYDNGFDARFEREMYDGVRSGRLSDREVTELRQQKAELDRLERRAGWDGHVGRDERAELFDRQYDLEKTLNHELNDGERRRF